MSNQIIINVKFIKSYMKENEISLNKLAEEIGISPATLSRVLNNHRNPGQRVMGKMLKYFSIPFDELFFYDFELTKVNDKVEKQIVI